MILSIVRLLGIALVVLAGTPTLAQVPTWQMALTAGGGAYSTINDAATDAAGNVYIAGWFSNSQLVLGSLTLTNAVTSGSTVGFSKDAFVAKWSPITHDFVWALRAGGTTDNDAATNLALDNGNVYVATTLDRAAAGLGGGPPASGYYLTKLTEAGSQVWAQPVGGPLLGLAASNGNVFATGSFSGTASFGSTSYTSLGTNDMYITKLFDRGTSSSYAWTQRVGITIPSKAIALSGNNLYVSGDCYGSSNIGGLALPGQGSFVAKLTDMGMSSTATWVQLLSSQATPTLNSPGISVEALAASGSAVYLAGVFTGRTTIGATTLTSVGYSDLLVARLDELGATASPSWVRQAGGAGGNSIATSLVVAGGSVYVAGNYDGAFSFDSSPGIAWGSSGCVVAKLLDTGTNANVAWLHHSEGLHTYINALTHSGDTFYVAGMAGSGSTFGALSTPSVGGPKAVLASFTTAGATPLAAGQAKALPGLSLFPNPASHAATMHVPAGTDMATLILLDELGRTVRTTQAVAGQDYSLQLGGLAPGMYVVHVRMGDALATQKLVVE